MASIAFNTKDAAEDTRLKLRGYQETRQTNEQLWYSKVVRVSSALMVAGVIWRLLSVALFLVPSLFYVATAVEIVGSLLLFSGTLIMSTCPTEAGVDGNVAAVSFDKSMHTNTATWNLMILAGALLPFVQALSSPVYRRVWAGALYTAAFAALPCMYALVRQGAVYNDHEVRPSTVVVFFLFLTLGSWGITQFRYAFEPDLSSRAKPFMVAAGVIRSCVSVASICVWFVHRRITIRQRQALVDQGRQSRDPDATLALFAAIYTFMVATGACDLLMGFGHYCNAEIKGSYRTAVYYFISAPLWFQPIVIILFGRRELRLQLKLMFEDSRAQYDGAFIAELLDTVPVAEMGVWYVMREQPNDVFEDDHRRFWRRGIVEKSTSSAISVKVSRDSLADRFSFALNALDSMRESQIQTHEVHVQGTSGKSSDQLLTQAKDELRCIDWENIDLELMTGSIQGTSAVDISDLLQRSRLVKAGESIDYFMSHSWKDDAVIKYEMLEDTAKKFKKRNGRFPTFWLDKTCIDQKNITDGLKVLPINVMACDKMLVLCGKTYPTRLWCVWELFTLLAFTSREQAGRKIEFIPMLDTNQTVADVLQPLRLFKLSGAHCFDPNEEIRLRTIIHARGESLFEERIRTLAEVCGDTLRQRRRTSSSSTYIAFNRFRSSSNAAVELGLTAHEASSVITETTDV
jgi:hypothetical protein